MGELDLCCDALKMWFLSTSVHGSQSLACGVLNRSWWVRNSHGGVQLELDPRRRWWLQSMSGCWSLRWRSSSLCCLGGWRLKRKSLWGLDEFLKLEVEGLGFLEARVCVEEKGDFGELWWRQLLWRSEEKNEMKCKGFVYMGFGICKGGGNCIERRGFGVKGKAWGVTLHATWPAMGRREG